MRQIFFLTEKFMTLAILEARGLAGFLEVSDMVIVSATDTSWVVLGQFILRQAVSQLVVV